MLKVVRKAIVRKEETYTLYLDDEYVAGVNKYLHDVAAEEIPVLTANDIVNIIEIQNCSGELFEKEYKWINYRGELFEKKYKWIDYRGDIYTQELWEKVDEIVNDDIWDCDPDEDFLETEDWHTDVYEG